MNTVMRNDLQETDYKPSKRELLALFKYWWREHEWINFEAWRDQAGIIRLDWQEQCDANGRMSRIEEIVGQEEVKKACEQARQDFMRFLGPETFRIWTKGTPEEVSEFHRKHEEEMTKVE